jgi:hypothetical protein
MTDTTIVALPPPSRRTIVKATVIALAVALVLLVTIVLPAEYGIDPLGSGSALGLNGLAETNASSAPAVIIPAAGGR